MNKENKGRDFYFKIVRLISWGIILGLLAYVFISSLFDPSRAEIMSRVIGMQAYMQILWVNVYALILCMVLLLIGCAMQLVFVVLRKSLSPGLANALLCLSDFIFAAAIWVLTDSYFLSLVTMKTVIVALISYLSFTTMFAFLFEFINYLTGKRKSLYVLCVIFYLVALVQLIYALVMSQNSVILILPVHVCAVGGAIYVIFSGRKVLKSQELPEVRKAIWGFTWMLIFSLAAMALFYVNSSIPYSVLYSIGICIFCGCLVASALIVVKKQIEHEAGESMYRHLAYTDVMTGMMNKAAYIEEEKKPLTDGCIYLMMDLNNLKQINDQYGHRVGDEVITTAAGYIKRYYKEALCYRFGGDEFIVICRTYTVDEVRSLIVQMRDEMDRDNRTREVPVAMAVGYSVYQPSDTVEDMFLRADKAMYDDKVLQKAGR